VRATNPSSSSFTKSPLPPAGASGPAAFDRRSCG
jgi:hypothetical protein